MSNRDDQIAKFRTQTKLERFVANFLNEFPYRLFAEFPELYGQLDGPCPVLVENAVVELVAQAMIKAENFEATGSEMSLRYCEGLAS